MPSDEGKEEGRKTEQAASTGPVRGRPRVARTRPVGQLSLAALEGRGIGSFLSDHRRLVSEATFPPSLSQRGLFPLRFLHAKQ